MPITDLESLEQELGTALARADSEAVTVVPILRHVLSNEDNSLFGDEIVARIRGMVRHIAVQLLDRLEAGENDGVPSEHPAERVASLSDLLIESEALVRHLHALALETQLCARLHIRFGSDPVLTPLLQAQIASSDPDLAALAMRFLAAQARHGQSQRRMKLPLLELPGDHLHHALLALRALVEESSSAAGETAAQGIRRDYEEASTRLGLASLLLARMGADAAEALRIDHAGAALFVSALEIGAGLDRDSAVLATHETQAARLALALRSAGMKPALVREQCLALHPELDFPEQFDALGPDRAAALLASGSSVHGY
ncbi:MAG: hypothetical protein KDE32_15845 [Novosphingobium sp.]|nr:hypothetical protein [Novosphingobium sp.]